MIKDVVETAMGAEMTGFLGYDRYQTPDSAPGNRRTGYSQKELASKVGPLAIDVPRDRKSEFAPAIVKKRQKDIGGFEVHQVRNSLAQMAWKDREEVSSSLRLIYTAPTEEAGLMALAEFEDTWGRKYPMSCCPGNGTGRNWRRFSTIPNRYGG
jgi:transposase-like protein